jgi:hypothetical protein
MKTAILALSLLLSLTARAPAQTNAADPADAKPLPTIDFLLQKVIARAVSQEDRNDELFDMNYQYTRVRTWEYRNSAGKLKSREEKRSVENKPLRLRLLLASLRTSGNKPVPPPPPVVKNEPLSETHSNIRGKALKVKNYSIPNLVKRFQFTLVGREMLNGRPSLVVDFKPLNDHLPVNQFADKFINQAAGRVWVDEEDYAIAQAHLYLTKQVNVLGGIVGAIWKFTYQFTRLRTPEGYWFARSMDWHLEGREVVINRIVDYHERKLDEQKIVATASAR